MNGINTIDIPTVSGLRNLQLDQIDTDILNADTIILENVQTPNIIISDQIILLSGSSIVANSSTISDVEISYLDGLDSNIQGQIDSLPNDTRVIALETKTQNFSASSGVTNFSGNISLSSGSNILANSSTISDVEISYLDGVTSNIQSQINSIPDPVDITDLENKTQNITVDGNITEFDNAILVDEIYLNSGGFIDFVDEIQYDAFTTVRKNKLDDTTLVNSSNKLNADLIATGIISNTEFNYLDGVTSNIQSQLNTLFLPNMSQKFLLNTSIINGSSSFTNNTEYDDTIKIDMRDLSGFDLQWQYNGIRNNDNEFIKLGAYLIDVRVKFINLKWYKNFLFTFHDIFPSNDIPSIAQGIELVSSSSNEANKYVTASHVMHVTNTTYHYFELYFNFWFAAGTSGSSYMNMEIQITQL